MGFNIRCVVNCGVLLAIMDLMHGLGTLGFYVYQYSVHYNCQWNHGIRWCSYYLEETDHNQRVQLGIGEGIVCIIFAALLIVALCKYNPWLAWCWVLKALAVIGLNGYFITIWLMQKSRYYHQFWSRHNYDQDNIFLITGIALTLFELFLSLVFCCVVGSFTHKVRKQRVPTMETDI